MTSRTPGTTARVAWSALAVASLAVGSFGFALPATAAADIPITENGGAARNQDDRTDAIRDALDDSGAKNVILLIGDGMGDSEITVARNYAEGAGGTFDGIDALPLTGQYVHWAVDEQGNPNYASESASTASAWSTGTKTVNGKLSVDYQNTPQSTLLEIAKANGMKTGNVSTSEIQDATPGAEISHISKRGCYGPVKTTLECNAESLEEGGLGSISEQLLNVRPDVTLGGGSASFTEIAQAGPWAGQTLFAQAEDRGYQIVDDAAGLAAIDEADANAPVLGLFTAGNFPVRWNGPAAVDLTAGGTLPPAVPCTENPARLETGLSLASLTTKAIDLLDDEEGFFLQVEGASIDKQDHAANACGQIGETVDLDEAVQVALEFAKNDGDTLVVVTADHAHTSQIVGSAIPGLNTNLLTDEGREMIVAYGTSAAGGSQQHTGSQVRIAGYGPGAANVVGLTDQTDLFFTSANALGLERDLTKLSSDATLAAPTEVAPGAEFTVTTSGLDADWQATALIGSEPTDPAQVDVLNGTGVFTVTAPEELGATTVTVTGAQTGTVLTAQVVVTADPAPVSSPSPSSTPVVAGTGGGPSTGVLAITGGSAPWVLAGIAGAMLAVGAYAVHRRRRGLA
ncbi:alkaline phosphatase [Microbacterium sp. P06]|uniref:alkaline phosphatase n=1 Tax=unclassified Microbacterium TaxID=2609290 RepID=UPI003745E732